MWHRSIGVRWSKVAYVRGKYVNCHILYYCSMHVAMDCHLFAQLAAIGIGYIGAVVLIIAHAVGCARVGSMASIAG